ncbi:hypothetical protein ABZZ80_06600 [Streptomyces sp. NPDC006356]
MRAPYAFYLYRRDPGGHGVEICTSVYYTGDPDHETHRWNVHDDRRREFWGNAVIESWCTAATPVIDLDGVPQRVTAVVLAESAVRVGPASAARTAAWQTRAPTASADAPRASIQHLPG